MTKHLTLLLFIGLAWGQSSTIPERNEIISERHPNGLKKLVLVFEGTGLNEILVGKYGFYDNGIKDFIESYENNRKNGKSIYWYKNGDMKQEINYKDGLKNGLFTNWYENGQMQSRGVRTEYFESGLWTYWHETGHKKAEGFWGGKDERKGKWNFWNDQGQLICSGIHSAWQGDGLWIFWDDDGTKIHEREYRGSELLDVWKNLRIEGYSDESIEIYKELIFDLEP